MKVAYDIRVTGKVQGVFYRASTQEKSKELNVTGWCKNLDNGDVQIHAEGKQVDLQALLLWCKLGPPKAVVDSVHYTEVQLEHYSEFTIER